MTTNQTIDGAPRDYVLRLTPEAYSVMLGMVEHCLNIRACMGMDEGFKDFDTEEEHAFVKELRALLDAPAENVIDVSVVSWDEIQKAASESTWMPPEYMRNDWVDDVCRFLREGPAAQPQGEPVYIVRSHGSCCWEEMRGESLEMCQAQPGEYEVRKLYAEQPAPVAVVMPERLQQVLKFLDGAENLDGHWFGEPHPSGRPYWWRNELRKALAETNLFAKQL